MARHGKRSITARQPRGDTGEFRRLQDPDDIEPFLEDAAHYPGGSAAQVCFPTNEAQIAQVLAAAGSQHTGVVAVGAQTSLTGGATPKGEIVMSTAAMASLISCEAGGVVAQPGLVLHDLIGTLDARGAYYPAVPTFDGATVGGIVATNAAGAATFKYGTTREWVEAITVVLACGDVLDLRRGEVLADADGVFEIELTDGSSIRLTVPAVAMPAVPKKSAGYFAEPGMDLIDLFIGAEGTLGVVTEVHLRVMDERPGVIVGLVPMPDEAALIDLVGELHRESLKTWSAQDPRGIDISAIEYMDWRSLELLEQDGVYERLGLRRPPGAAAALVFQAELPEGTGAADAREQIAGSADGGQDTPLTRLCRVLQAHGVFEEAVPALPDETSRRNAIFALREAVPEAVNRRVGEIQRRVDATVTKSAGDVIVPFESLGESLRRYRGAADSYGLDLVVWGHVSDGNVHPNVIARDGAEMEKARSLQLDIGQCAIDLGGCPMSEHGVGRNPVKKELLRRLYGDAGLESMRAVKRALDPEGVLSPGVLFD